MSAQLRVYIAGSFKQREICVEAGRRIRDAGVYCYVFCDDGSDAFFLSMKLRKGNLIDGFTPMSAVQHNIVQNIYIANMQELSCADVVVLMLPCGKSAHMEAGYIKGVEGKLIIYGEMIKGEFDAMYCMADLVTDNFQHVLEHLKLYANFKGEKLL